MTSKLYQIAMEAVEPQYREQFKRFLKTGELSEEFDKYLEGNKKAQDVIEEAFKIKVELLQKSFRDLDKTDIKNSVQVVEGKELFLYEVHDDKNRKAYIVANNSPEAREMYIKANPSSEVKNIKTLSDFEQILLKYKHIFS